jgi:hypothetical protein
MAGRRGTPAAPDCRVQLTTCEPMVSWAGLNAADNEGVVVMKVGGRRELIVAPDLAYEGLSNATVVLVVDLLRIN